MATADIVARATGSYNWFFVGYVLTIAGFGCGIIAALPGLIDYLKVVPSRSAAKQRATLHMGLNAVIVALYIVSWLVKNTTKAPPSWASLILEIVGCALLAYSGWLGWTLVNRDHIGLGEKEAVISLTDQRRVS